MAAQFPRSVFLMVALAAGCRQAGPPPAGEMPPLSVKVAAPVECTVTDYKVYSGRVMAVERVDVMARADGYLSEIRFKPGQTVQKGDVLFVIDRRPYQALLDNAKAQLAQAEARATRLTKDHERLKRLVDTGAGTIEEFDKVVGDLAEAKAAVQAAQASVAQASLNLEFTEVKAPIKGRVGREMVTVGNLVQAATPTGATVLTDIVSVDPVYVFFEVPEKDTLTYRRTMLADLTPGTMPKIPVEVGLFDESDFPHKGVVEFMHERIDMSTGTQAFRAVVPNPKGRLLADGMFARVRVAFSPPYAGLAVADRAVVTVQGHKSLYVVNAENKLEERPVELGLLVAPGLRQVKSGVKKGDRVVISSLHMLMPGATVQPIPSPMQEK